MLKHYINLVNLHGNLYVTDLLDILIIALLIYSALLILKRTRTYMIFLGMAFMVGLFIIAKTLDLYLTSLALQYLIGVSVVIFVIIFQTEIRKYFELIGLVGTRRIKIAQPAENSPSTVEIIQSCVKMAQNKIGALIVVQGTDDLDGFVEGGNLLDGMISEEVILSIFDPTSEGHDGAMLVKNNRIYKFGVHLPLSNNFKEIGKHGTRHSAALGLSETSDAMCIVVSEERGSISLCREGKIKTLGEFTDLEKELGKFIKLKFSKKRENMLTYMMKHNFILKVGAVALSSLIWFFYAYQTAVVEKSYTVPITLENLPKDTVIESYKPETLKVVLKGRGDRVFSTVTDTSLKLESDVSDIQDGVNKKSVSDSNLSVPSNLSVVSIEPDSYLLTAKRYYQSLVPISVKISGTVEKGLELMGVVTNTENVELAIPLGTTPPSEIPTETIDITNQSESVIIPVNLIIPDGLKPTKSDGTVNVALTIEKI